MPLSEFFNQIPPFPDGVNLYDLPEVSLASIEAGDSAESQRLFKACCDVGFFLINLESSETGTALLSDTGAVFETSKATHALPMSELQSYRFDPPYSLFGYKGVGGIKIEDGSPDNCSFYNVGRDDMLGVTERRANPSTIDAARSLFQPFFTHAHSVINTIYCQLESHLHLPKGAISELNPLDRPSGTIVRLLKSVATSSDDRTDLLGHTDIGSITMLFNIVGGLQILPPGLPNTDENWRYVKPKPGCAVINIGDALVEWSGGVLRSNMHRVVTPPSTQRDCVRYSVAYLVRPDGDAPMRALDSKAIPVAGQASQEQLCARDWQVMRATGIMNGKNLARSLGGTAVLATDEPVQIRIC